MSIDPKEFVKPRYGQTVGGSINNWGTKLNDDLGSIDERLAALEAPPATAEKHETLGIVAGAATLAAIGVSSAKPVSRRGMFNLFRSKNAAR